MSWGIRSRAPAGNANERKNYVDIGYFRRYSIDMPYLDTGFNKLRDAAESRAANLYDTIRIQVSSSSAPLQ
ncbi:jg22642 [Pararge aegeria aegeria]|uniref:Jg22642 protein n=1 Tax=Pararge aegeria aegeria TaxID=348720 RepID=A0A8S4R7D7_9NEOP|nr:jg22642 [Pararge aegeria aegeria]